MSHRTAYFERLMELHPVLPLVVKSGDIEREDNLILDTYVHSRARTRDHLLPMSITQFYHSYMEMLMQMSLAPTHRHNVEANQELVHKVTHKLGAFGTRNLLDSAEIEGKDINELKSSLPELHNLIPRDVAGLPGLKDWITQLEEEDENCEPSTNKYKFTEPGVQKYLVVLNLANTTAEAWNAKKWLPCHTKQLLYFFRRTAVGQARFWEMWGLMFGLMANMANKDLLEEMMDITRKVVCKVDINQSELCIAYACMVYECKNKHGLITYGDDYLPNQAFKIDGKEIKFYQPYCLSYIMTAVGYLLGVTKFIHSLTLSNLGITVQQLGHMLSAASNSMVPHTLQVLDLSHNKLEKSGAVRLQVFLVKATSLTHLNLSNCCLGTDGMMALSKVLDCMPLVSLNLSRNDIGNDGVTYLVAKWRNCYCLTELDLSCNNITDGGAVTIGTHLKDLVGLRSLRLFGNEIIGDGIYSIYRGMDMLEATPVPCGHLAREDTSKDFTCCIYLEVCTVQKRRKYDRPQITAKLRVSKPELSPDDTLQCEDHSQTKESLTYIGYDTVDGDTSVSEDTILAQGRKSSETSIINSTLCKHESLLATSTPMGTPGTPTQPTKAQLRVAAILKSQPQTPVRRRWSTLPNDLTTDTTSSWNRSMPLDRSATLGGIDRSQTISAADRRRPLDRTPSTRVVGRRPSTVRPRQWDRERRLRKIMSKPLVDRSLLDVTTHTTNSVSFLESLPVP